MLNYVKQLTIEFKQNSPSSQTDYFKCKIRKTKNKYSRLSTYINSLIFQKNQDIIKKIPSILRQNF